MNKNLLRFDYFVFSEIPRSNVSAIIKLAFDFAGHCDSKPEVKVNPLKHLLFAINQTMLFTCICCYIIVILHGI